MPQRQMIFLMMRTLNMPRRLLVKQEGLKKHEEKMEESLMDLVACVKGKQLRRSDKAKKKHEALKEKGSQEPMQKFGIIKAPTPAVEVDVPRSTAQVEKPTNVHVPIAEVEAKDVPAPVDENVV
ncbi:hypothetical protein K7X08_014661 [Anisodus acutangulus]|uniref:Uncharacterized protein n=1 Tax=Anisodus acutangulus TaxID=402998 RepID=A0A9Q1R4K2_9SOLA|nr:hypothetical protein K7X08_014661 [Anisodus acutangulus]